MQIGKHSILPGMISSFMFMACVEKSGEQHRDATLILPGNEVVEEDTLYQSYRPADFPYVIKYGWQNYRSSLRLKEDTISSSCFRVLFEELKGSTAYFFIHNGEVYRYAQPEFVSQLPSQENVLIAMGVWPDGTHTTPFFYARRIDGQSPLMQVSTPQLFFLSSDTVEARSGEEVTINIVCLPLERTEADMKILLRINHYEHLIPFYSNQLKIRFFEPDKYHLQAVLVKGNLQKVFSPFSETKKIVIEVKPKI